MITGDLMSLNSHKSFESSSPFLYSLKRWRRKVGLSQGRKVPSKCSAKLKMRGGMASHAKTHTERERKRERVGLRSSALSQKKFIELLACVCVSPALPQARDRSPSQLLPRPSISGRCSGEATWVTVRGSEVQGGS